MRCERNSKVPAGICKACIWICHEGHMVEELQTDQPFRCDCGNSKFADFICLLQPDKDQLNVQNADISESFRYYDEDEFVNCFESLENFQMTNGHVYLNRAYSYLRKELYYEAIDDVNTAFAWDPEKVAAMINTFALKPEEDRTFILDDISERFLEFVEPIKGDRVMFVIDRVRKLLGEVKKVRDIANDFKGKDIWFEDLQLMITTNQLFHAVLESFHVLVSKAAAINDDLIIGSVEHFYILEVHVDEMKERKGSIVLIRSVGDHWMEVLERARLLGYNVLLDREINERYKMLEEEEQYRLQRVGRSVDMYPDPKSSTTENPETARNDSKLCKRLEKHLSSYFNGDNSSWEDVRFHMALNKPPSDKYPNVVRWYNDMEGLMRSGASFKK